MHQNETGNIGIVVFVKLHVCLDYWYKDSLMWCTFLVIQKRCFIFKLECLSVYVWFVPRDYYDELCVMKTVKIRNWHSGCITTKLGGARKQYVVLKPVEFVWLVIATNKWLWKAWCMARCGVHQVV